MSENTFPPQIKKSYFQGKEPEKRRTKSLLRVCLRLLFTNTLYVLVKSRSKQEAFSRHDAFFSLGFDDGNYQFLVVKAHVFIIKSPKTNSTSYNFQKQRVVFIT